MSRAAILRALPRPGAPYAQSAPLRLEEVDLPTPRPGEIAVDVTLASLCHSDLSVVNGSRPRPLPMALGHEAVGTVSDVGVGIEDLAVGDHVVLVFVPSCGRCDVCLAGRPALCPVAADANGRGGLLHGPAVMTDGSGRTVHHHLGVSAFAERAVVARESAVKIPKDVPAEVAALLGCAALTGIGAVRHSVAVSEGDTVVVFGLGAVGLCAVMGAKAQGARHVIAVDPVRSKWPIATEAGATAVGSPDDVSRLLLEAAVDGADVAVEAAGHAAVLAAALDAVGRGGAVVAVGLPHPDARLDVPALAFAGAGKRLIGSYMGDAVPAEDIPLYLDWWRHGLLPLELLHSDTKPLTELNEGLDDLAAGRVVRRLFDPRR